ncbi:MAG: hypothetical protein BWK78_10200 [Thiotrichaceae bacterium IS1]|nr:MAG: hypothetical protein BWK78_10200 [Thiotrichaceae bacterium IS1]
MTNAVLQMTPEELKDMIEILIEQKLMEMFGNLDDGLELQERVYQRLLRQKRAVLAGERGQPFAEVVQQLNLG